MSTPAPSPKVAPEEQVHSSKRVLEPIDRVSSEKDGALPFRRLGEAVHELRGIDGGALLIDEHAEVLRGSQFRGLIPGFKNGDAVVEDADATPSATDSIAGIKSMPLYTVTTQAGVLSGKAKTKLAAELTAFHSEYADVPKNWVHIVFLEYAAGNDFTSGEVAATAALTTCERHVPHVVPDPQRASVFLCVRHLGVGGSLISSVSSEGKGRISR